MLENIKYFLKHSAIYSIGNFATKASGLILLPIYTTYITLGEFGELGILDVTILILVELINLGQSQALVMLNNTDEYSSKKKEVFFTILSSSTIVCIIFILLGEFLLPRVSGFFVMSEKFYLYLKLSLFIISARIITNVLLNKLRADERSISYTTFSILKLVLTISLTAYFVAFAHLKVLGILYSYLISEIAIIGLLLPMMFKSMRFKFDKKILYASISFGVPLIFGSLAMMLLNVSDRYIIKYFTNNEMVGLYDLGYRFAGALNMFIIMPITLTLLPQAYKMYNKPGDKRYYSKIMTYLTFLLVWVGLAISVFSMEIIKVFALNPTYWPAYKIVPLVTFAYVFFGMRILSSLGMFLTKETKYVAITTVLAAVINIGLNFILIPKFGMIAAAYTTLASFLVLYLSSYYYSNKFYKIPFEDLKLLKLFILGLGFYFLSSLSNDSILVIRLILKIFLLVIFPFVLLLFKFYEPVEIESIKGFFNKWKSPVKWKENINTEIKKSKKESVNRND